MPRGLKVSRMLIVDMILFANIINFLKRKIIVIMAFIVAHWDT